MKQLYSNKGVKKNCKKIKIKEASQKFPSGEAQGGEEQVSFASLKISTVLCQSGDLVRALEWPHLSMSEHSSSVVLS